MRLNSFEQQLTDLIRPEVESLGHVFWGLTAPSAGKKRIVRIYIDNPDGVTIDQCAKVSRHVGLILEVEDIVPGAYTLEVSSPGFERRFFTLEQMADYVGREVTVKLHDPRDGQRNFKGGLVRIDPEGPVLDIEGDEMFLEWEDVKEARLVHNF
ncbi:ribosome maturation factor RimP [Pseudodesulfovibrio tunisiensis]|uniref:ribosome maturation factor RimP n=1 Tax=Pseudodesulfovibrio tunisiensis TaxID=463192 RepID=UPI001FB26EBD|nr:ribosome maturation factor RimP [Pseudodesulfovibrio tunisiensis]